MKRRRELTVIEEGLGRSDIVGRDDGGEEVLVLLDLLPLVSDGGSALQSCSDIHRHSFALSLAHPLSLSFDTSSLTLSFSLSLSLSLCAKPAGCMVYAEEGGGHLGK